MGGSTPKSNTLRLYTQQKGQVSVSADETTKINSYMRKTGPRKRLLSEYRRQKMPRWQRPAATTLGVQIPAWQPKNRL